jgi:EAL domain-containing protein (putative c-di-GMP-specific phosphodiesterase class I)
MAPQPLKGSSSPDRSVAQLFGSRPPSFAGPGKLHLAFEQPTPLGKAVALSKQAAWEATSSGATLSIRVPGNLFDVVRALASGFTATEQTQVRVVFEPDGDRFDVADHFESGSLMRFMARRQSAWLLDMIVEDRLVPLFQPIVDASTVSLFGYECLVRGLEEGTLVGAPQLLQVAGGAGLLLEMDQAARSAAIRQAARFGLDGKIFINFSPTAFEEDPVLGLRDTVRLLDDLDIPRQRVVFEIIETERIIDIAHLERTLDYYRELDFEVALDDVGTGYSSLNLLQRLRPDYAKLDVQLVRNVDRNGYKAVLTAKLLEASMELGVRTIAEGVETRGEHEWLRLHGADYLQGFYFAHPASPPPSLPGN